MRRNCAYLGRSLSKTAIGQNSIINLQEEWARARGWIRSFWTTNSRAILLTRSGDAWFCPLWICKFCHTGEWRIRSQDYWQNDLPRQLIAKWQERSTSWWLDRELASMIWRSLLVQRRDKTEAHFGPILHNCHKSCWHTHLNKLVCFRWWMGRFLQNVPCFFLFIIIVCISTTLWWHTLSQKCPGALCGRRRITQKLPEGSNPQVS